MKISLLIILASLAAVSTAWSAGPRVEIPNAAQPQLAVAADGRVWLAFGRLEAGPPAAKSGGHAQHKGHRMPDRAGDIFVTWSNDGGASFATPVKVATVPKLMLGMRRGPRIAVHGDTLTLTAVGTELLAFSSRDGGRTWFAPVTINEVPASAREGLHDLAGASDGQLFVTWLDLRNGKTELWGAGSKDGGRTWARNEPIYRSPDTTICECCHPSALFDAEGNLAVMWRNALSGARDMWLSVRPNGATRFDPARKLGEGTWQLNACPMDGGRIVASGRGTFASVWQRAGEVFFSPAAGREINLGKGKQPVAIGAGADTLVIWQQNADLMAATIAQTEPRKVATNVRFPSLVALPRNGALLAYEEGTGIAVVRP